MPSVISAISISGFSDNFVFYGFFPEKEKKIKQKLELLSDYNFCLVFFISPKKINKVIPYIKQYFKDRKILICREISKFYEEYIRSSVNKIELFKNEPKGELTIVISEKEIDKKFQCSKIIEEYKQRVNIVILIILIDHPKWNH